MGVPEYEAKRYEAYISDGGMLISVHADDSRWSTRAKQILTSAGAEDVDLKYEKRSPDTASIVRHA
jgi:hypothetical protein